jgi:hypothetical protein
MRKCIGKLDREIKLAAERLLTAPDNMTDVLAPQIEARRREREAIEDKLAEADRLSRPADLRTEALAIVEKLDHVKIRTGER